MNPTQEQLDPQVLNLVKAIRETETRGQKDPYTAKGSSGEFGAYQYTKPTWEKDSQQFLGRVVPLEQADRLTQNEVAYKKVKALKDQGYNPAQIASVWNSGGAEYEGKRGTNKFGVKYDVPQYVDSVTKSYQALKNGGTPTYTPTSSTIGNEKMGEPDKEKEGFLKSLARGITQPVATLLARPVQLGAELLGASAEDVNKVSAKVPFFGKEGRLNVPETGKDVVKDIGRGAETVALGMPVGSVGKAIGVGAVAGAGAGLEKDASLSGAVKGSAIGAGAGLVGGGISKALTSLPKWLTKGAFGLDDVQAEKMLATKKLGTKNSLLTQSEKSVAEQGAEVRKIIAEAEKAGKRGSGNDSLRRTVLDYPEFNSDKGIEKFVTKIKRLIPNTGEFTSRREVVNAIDKVVDGTATLTEKNMVRSALDQATSGGYARMARALSPSAGHDLAMSFANNLRKEVQQWVPESQTYFDELAKEMAIRSALRKVAKKSSDLIGYSDILPFMAGESVSGIGGGLGGLIANKILRSPATQYNIARGVNQSGKVVKPVLNRVGLMAGLGSGGAK